MITNKTIDLVKRHEGLRLKPYTCTAGKLTVGYGRNLDDRGITAEEAESLLRNDLAAAEKDARGLLRNYDLLTEARQAVIIDMALNLGKSRLSLFKKFLAAVDKGDYPAAVKEMLDSAWAGQVKGRATELANLMQRGAW